MSLNSTEEDWEIVILDCLQSWKERDHETFDDLLMRVFEAGYIVGHEEGTGQCWAGRPSPEERAINHLIGQLWRELND